MLRVHVVEVGVVGLLAHGDGVLETDALEGLVPFQDAGFDAGAVALGDVAVQEVGDGFDGLAHRRGRVFLFQAPAFEVVHARVGAQVVTQVGVAVGEEAHARVGWAAGHGHGRQFTQVVDIADKQAARVGRGLRWRRRGRRRGAGWQQRRRRNARHEVVHLGGQGGQPDFGTGGLEVGIAAVHRKRQPEGLLQPRAVAHQVAQQETGIDQHALALGVVGAGHGGRSDQAFAEAFTHGAGRGTVARRPKGQLLGHHLHLVAHAAEFDQPARAHLAAVQPPFTHRLRDVDAEQHRLGHAFWRDFQPHLFVFAPQRHKTVLAAGVLDDLCKRFGGSGVRAGG